MDTSRNLILTNFVGVYINYFFNLADSAPALRDFYGKLDRTLSQIFGISIDEAGILHQPIDTALRFNGNTLQTLFEITRPSDMRDPQRIRLVRKISPREKSKLANSILNSYGPEIELRLKQIFNN